MNVNKIIYKKDKIDAISRLSLIFSTLMNRVEDASQYTEDKKSKTGKTLNIFFILPRFLF